MVVLRALLVAASVQAFQRTPPNLRQRACVARPVLAETTLVVADAESALGSLVKFLPFVAVPGVVVGIPFLVYTRLAALEGDDYTGTVFTDKDPPRKYYPGQDDNAGPSKRQLEELSYEELRDKFGDPTLMDSMPRAPEPEPEPEPPAFELPAFELPSFFGSAPSAPEPAPEPEPEPELEEEPPFKFPWQ